MLTQFPTGIVAVVSDSYDVWRACDELWGNQLKSQIEKREGTLVIRPDSGVPHEVVVKVGNSDTVKPQIFVDYKLFISWCAQKEQA